MKTTEFSESRLNCLTNTISHLFSVKSSTEEQKDKIDEIRLINTCSQIGLQYAVVCSSRQWQAVAGSGRQFNSVLLRDRKSNDFSCSAIQIKTEECA